MTGSHTRNEKAQAILLAAGRGERMRPLTDSLPKPLLEVHGKPLMQWPMEALARDGFSRIAINTAWQGDAIPARYGAHPVFDGGAALAIDYSHEGRDFGGALETAGGILRALPLLDGVFWVMAGDVFMPGFRFTREAYDSFSSSGKLAHIWLVPNPAHNAKGDFGLSQDGLALNRADEQFTYSTVGLYRQEFFTASGCGIVPGNPLGVKAPLAPLLRTAMDRRMVGASLYTGEWADIGTPERLRQINARC